MLESVVREVQRGKKALLETGTLIFTAQDIRVLFVVPNLVRVNPPWALPF